MESLHKQNVKVDIIGRKNNLPSSLQDNIRKIEKLTKNNSELNLNIAFNYGGRAEIVDTCKKFIAESIRKENISEKLISNNLYNNNISDIEILIRTGGDRRISNFLLWEIAYAELYFIEKYWPEFTTDDFELIIKDFQKRERRFGGLKEAGE